MSIDFTSYGPLDEALRTDRSSFWDDISTANVTEGPAETWARALRAADAELQDILPDGDEQRLDRLRTLTFPHAFDGQPVLGDLFNIGPIGMGGDSATVNVANASPLAPRQIGYIPSVRVVYTPADWAGTRGTLPLGQSGHRLSRYRSDQLDDWLAGDGHAWPWNGPPASDLIGELRLVPGGKGHCVRFWQKAAFGIGRLPMAPGRQGTCGSDLQSRRLRQRRPARPHRGCKPLPPRGSDLQSRRRRRWSSAQPDRGQGAADSLSRSARTNRPLDRVGSESARRSRPRRRSGRSGRCGTGPRPR